MATTDDAPVRVMPQSAEAEVAVIASILINPRETLDRCVELLSPDHFYQRSHQVIFSTICAMYAKGEAVDTVTLTTRLRDLGKLEEVGGASPLHKLAVTFPTTAHLEHYLGILREKHHLRRLIEAATRAVQSAYDTQQDVEKVLDQAQTEILNLGDGGSRQETIPIKEIAERVVCRVRELHESRGKLPGLSWGFRDLNKLTFGLRAAEMVVIAARPGVGKTSLALNIAEKLVLDEKIPVAVFSLEMTAEQLALRMACSKARINSWNLYSGGIAEKDIQEFSRAAGIIGSSPLYILDAPQPTISQLRASARRLKSLHKIQFLVIDYLQLVRGSGLSRNDGREREVSMISAGIKALAKDLDIPVLVLSQLNREMERNERKPRLSDLRESGAIEQDADIVCLMVQADPPEDGARRSSEPLTVDVSIAKNRNGPVGEIKLTFLREYTRFEDHTDQEDI